MLPTTCSDRLTPCSNSDDNASNVTRKQKQNEADWLCNKRKRLRNSGSSYGNKKQKWCKARSIKVSKCHDTCRKKCSEKVSDDQRATLFGEFWKLGNYDAQNVFLS